jgi:hypothetical protein
MMCGKSCESRRGTGRMLVSLYLRFSAILLIGLPLVAHSQVDVVTYHNDAARSGANVNETLLTPTNVNKATFGLRFSQPVDGYIVGQPLYLSNVAIPNAGTHNVVFVATLHDSVYAFDADSNTGSNGAPLWQVNFTNPAAGITTASGANLPCPKVTQYPEEGIVATPTIDTNTGTIYVVSKTVENGTVVHRLHALDVTTGAEKFGGSIVISGSFTANNGTVVAFNSLHALNRPGLSLNNGSVYIAFGSNGCNDSAHGWVFSYDAATLTQTGIFNTSPDQGPSSIWQTGSALSADEGGSLYFSTGEGAFTANTGGQDFGSSIVKLTPAPGSISAADYFTPYNQAFISQHDYDLSASGPIVLPDQPGPTPHLLIASGKQGTVYLLNRDSMGQYNPQGDTQILQEIPAVIGPMFSTPAYWNNTVYFAGNAHPIHAYTVSGGKLVNAILSTAPVGGAHSPTISANGTANGVLWVISGKSMLAFDAVSLKTLYTTAQSGTRDVLLPLAHFVTQTVANGNVYVGTQTSVMVYGLLPQLQVITGNNQSAPVTSQLTTPLQVRAVEPYSGQVYSGLTVTFSDAGRKGVFSNPTAITDSTGTATTSYTFAKTAATVTITAATPNTAPASFAEAATPAPAKRLGIISGNQQTAQTGAALPMPLVSKVEDAYSNGVPNVTVTFSDGGLGGTFSPNPVVSDVSGRVTTVYTTSTTTGTVTLTGAASGLVSAKFSATVTAADVTQP